MPANGKNLLESFKSISHFIFDIDGVLTDGQVLVFESGEQVRRMSIKDGFALQLAVKKNYRIAVVSGGNGLGAKNRLLKLGITDIFLQISDKKNWMEEYLQGNKLEWKNILYMGDDIPDCAVMAMAGMPCAPADAVPEVLRLAKYISPFAGGGGCVRDVIEKVLRLRGDWDLGTPIASR
ncbi:MAG: 3-deoxy-D-manno-octulosonate 8-phosphate phosphatase [Bacteroidota bacterium]|nr:3-deoxy-D-manno-octulosonate 8-phosphate phosphatase [Bacteroidota bacterium]